MFNAQHWRPNYARLITLDFTLHVHRWRVSIHRSLMDDEHWSLHGENWTARSRNIKHPKFTIEKMKIEHGTDTKVNDKWWTHMSSQGNGIQCTEELGCRSGTTSTKSHDEVVVTSLTLRPKMTNWSATSSIYITKWHHFVVVCHQMASN